MSGCASLFGMKSFLNEEGSVSPFYLVLFPHVGRQFLTQSHSGSDTPYGLIRLYDLPVGTYHCLFVRLLEDIERQYVYTSM